MNMKKIIFFLLFPITIFSQDFNGDAILTTQQEVNDFGQMGYVNVLGSLKIISSTAGTSTDISDLTPLNTIQFVGNNTNATSLEIIDNNNLISLDGLNNLKGIHGTLIIKDNLMLNSLSSLSELNDIYFDFSVVSGTLIIENNDSLTSLDGLQNLNQFFANLSIIDNNSLLSVSNLNVGSDEIIIENNPSLQTISNIDFNAVNNTAVDIFTIKDNPNLYTLSNIIGTVFITGILTIDNSNLSSLSGLENIQFGAIIAIGSIEIMNNDNLLSLNGLNTNLNLLGSVELDNNPLLSDINTLSNYSNGALKVAHCPSITSLNPLSNLNSCNRLEIEGVNGFTDLSGLENINNLASLTFLNTNLTDINQLELENQIIHIRIEGNNGITDLTIFDSIEIIGNSFGAGSLNIIDNDQLVSLNGFENVHTIIDVFNIENNDMLNDYCAFTNLFSTGTFSASYNVSGNEYNPSQTQIADGNSCSSLSVEDYSLNLVHIFPNPTTDYLHIQSEQEINTIEIYSLQGQKMASYKKQNTIDVSNLSNGIYFFKLTDDLNKVQNIKFIKE